MPQILSNASQMNRQKKPEHAKHCTVLYPSICHKRHRCEKRMRVRRPQVWRKRLARMAVSFIHEMEVMYAKMLEAASSSFSELCPSLKGALPRHYPPWPLASFQTRSKSAGSHHLHL